MSQNILVSNGTCYSAAGKKLDSSFIPCGNDAFGHVACCGAGDNCLADSSCFGVHGSGYGSYLTYQAGCTDPEYKDASCPNKIIDQPWIALTRCDDDTKVWAVCSQLNNPTTLQPGAQCSCTVAASATTAFSDSATLSSICSLPASTGQSIQFFAGHNPTPPPTTGAPPSSTHASTAPPSSATNAKSSTPPSTSASPTSASPASTAPSSSATTNSSSASESSSASLSSSNNSSSESGTSTASASSSSDSAAAAGAGGASSSSDSGLSTGAKAGIGVGVALGTLLLLGIIAGALIIRRRRRASDIQVDQEVGTSGVSGLGGASTVAAANEKKPMRDSGTTAGTAVSNPTAPEADSRPVSEADSNPAPPWALGRAELGGTPAAASANVEAGRQRHNGAGPGAAAPRTSGDLSPVAELPGSQPWPGREEQPRQGGGSLGVVGPEGASFPGESNEGRQWGWQWRRGSREQR